MTKRVLVILAYLMSTIISGTGSTTIGGSGNTSIFPGVLDQFTTNAAGPLTGERICEPGPGVLTLTATPTGAAFSIASNKLVSARPTAGQAYTAYGAVVNGGIERRAGIVLYGKMSSSIPGGVGFGFSSSAALDRPAAQGFNFLGTSSFAVDDNAAAIVLGTLTASTDYQLAIVLRGNGALFFVNGGTQYPGWKLNWIGQAEISASLWAMFANGNSAAILDDWTIKALTGIWLDEFGGAHGFEHTVTANDTFVGLADATEWFNWTPVANGTCDFRFRRTDDDNHWSLRCDQAAGTIKLWKREAASDLEFDTGKTQTWTAATTYRIGVRHEGENIRTFVNQVAKHSITGATFNTSATGTKITGGTALANWECWPWSWSGTYLDTLAPSGSTVSLATRPDRVVWVTDWHATVADPPTGVTYTRPNPALALSRHILSLHPECVIDTGDCANDFGVLADQQLFKANVRDILGPLHEVVPGNHDEEQDIGVGTSTSFATFDSVHGPLRRFSRTWASAGIQFIAVHTTMVHTGANEGSGHIEQSEIDWLEDEIDTMPVGRKAVICLHFPPVVFFGNYIVASEGGTNLLALFAAKASQIACTLSGHRHQTGTSTIDGNGILHISGGPVGQFKYQVLEHVAGIITVRMYGVSSQAYGKISPALYTPLTFAAGTP